jgi:uncharacterized protein YneF (UPF0154 family)
MGLLPNRDQELLYGETMREKSPLARLFLFIICLSIAGSIVAGAHYLAVDLPAKEIALHPPANSESCTILYTAHCTKIRATICRAGGTDLNWLKVCMKDNGCCV